MNNEISEEAKKSLANAAHLAASGRFEWDGASSAAALQRRVRATAQERNIPTAGFVSGLLRPSGKMASSEPIALRPPHSLHMDILHAKDWVTR